MCCHGDGDLKLAKEEASPYFLDDNLISNMTAQLTANVKLNCYVYQLKDRTVSYKYRVIH